MVEHQCWQVVFDRWSYHPVVGVSPGTSLDAIDNLARQAIEDQFNDRNVADLKVQSITRLQGFYTA